MTLIMLRSIFLYLFTLAAMRLMGKRQLGQLQPYEFVLILIISEIASLAMQSNTLPLMVSLIPILTLMLLEIIISLLNLKSPRFRRIICGKPEIVMSNGNLQQKQMRRLRLNINDITELCRAQGYFDLTELDTIVMETDGQISIFPKTAKRNVQLEELGLAIAAEKPSEIFIQDGRINSQTLQNSGHDFKWLSEQLKRLKIDDYRQVFIAGLDNKGQFFLQEKE